MNLLIVEDEFQLAGALHRGLTAEGHKVTLAPDGHTGLELARRIAFDFVLLDVNLPDISGFDVCAAIRKAGIETPIIMITARDEVADRVRGLTDGADDYLAKPFAFEELLARIAAISRRLARPGGSERADGTMACGDIIFDPRSMAVTRGGVALQLTVKELGVLRLLLTSPGTVISRTEILRAVWGIEDDPLTNIVEVYLSRLRRKLQALGPPCIENVRGFGYRLIG